MTVASNKLAKAQEVSAAKGVRAAVPTYIEATNALVADGRPDVAAGVLLDLLNVREKKRSLFGSKEINPLGPDRVVVAKHFCKLTQVADVTDPILELLGVLAAEFPDESTIRFANAEALYRAAYIADAIDEYRYCEHLNPADGNLTARLGELYAMVSRTAEAADSLRRGIARLREARQFGGVAAFCLRLVEVAPESANEVREWVEAFPEDEFAAQRTDIMRILDLVRERGADDGSWTDVEARLVALPEEAPPPLAEIVEEPNVWEDSSSFAPASEDEMRMLLGPAAARFDELSPERNSGITYEDEETGADAAQIKGAEGLQVSAGRVRPTSANEDTVPAPPAAATNAPPTPANAPSAAPGQRPASATPAMEVATAGAGAPLPPGLAAYTRRKADNLFAAGDFQAAAPCYERLLKAGFEPEVATLLLDCYLQLQRFDEASAIGMQLADMHAAAGDIEKALETLSSILQRTANAKLEQRRSELLAAASS